MTKAAWRKPQAPWGSLFGAKEEFRQHPHRGADQVLKDGELWVFPTDALVNEVFWSDVLGWVVEFQDQENTYIQIAHLKAKPKSYKSGDHMAAGKPLGLCGSSGTASTGPHGHWAMSKKPHPHLLPYGELMDPKKYWEDRVPAEPKPTPKPKAKNEKTK